MTPYASVCRVAVTHSSFMEKEEEEACKWGQTVMCPAGCRVWGSPCRERYRWGSQSDGHKEISAEGRRVTGVAGDFGSKHKDKRGGVTEEGKGSKGGEEVGCESVVSFVVQMLLETVTAKVACDWWAGLNCKVHLGLMAVASRLWTVTEGWGVEREGNHGWCRQQGGRQSLVCKASDHRDCLWCCPVKMFNFMCLQLHLINADTYAAVREKGDQFTGEMSTLTHWILSRHVIQCWLLVLCLDLTLKRLFIDWWEQENNVRSRAWWCVRKG